MGKEGMFAVKELKRFQSDEARLNSFIQSHVSRLLKSDVVSLLAELQRQDLVVLAMKVHSPLSRVFKILLRLRDEQLYDVVRREIWYRPDMFLYKDTLIMLARNKNLEEAKRVWGDMVREEVVLDQHTFGDVVRAFLDGGLPSEAMRIYEEMRQSPDPPMSLPYRVILKGLIPYPDFRQKVKADFLQLFPGMYVYDPADPSSVSSDDAHDSDSDF